MAAPQWTDYLSAACNVIVAVTALVAARGVYLGFQQWRRELLGKERHDIARRLVRLAFRFRDEYLWTRSPFTFAREYADRQAPEEEDPKEASIRNVLHAKLKRINTLQNTVNVIRRVSWEADIILGGEIGDLVRPLIDLYDRLGSSIEVYFSNELAAIQRPIGVQGPPVEDIRAYNKQVYGVESDEVSKTMTAAVDALIGRLTTYFR